MISTAIVRVADVCRKRATHPRGIRGPFDGCTLTDREAVLLSSLLSSVAIEIEHAMEEDRQSEIIAEQRRATEAVQLSATDLVRIPPEGVSLDEIERQAVLKALAMTGWVQKDAAELLRIHPQRMSYKMGLFRLRGQRPKLVRVG